MISNGIPVPRPTPKPTFVAVDMPIAVLWYERLVVAFPTPVFDGRCVAEELADVAGEGFADEKAEMLK